MNRDQTDGLSAALSNLGVSILLIGAVGPLFVDTNLRFGFWLSSFVSGSAGVIAIGVSIYLKRK